MRLEADRTIFVCYRRDDANAAAFGIYQRLITAFGQTAIFLDHFDFPAGQVWREETRVVLSRAVAVVVVIHKDWMRIGQQRFAASDDPVRRELELALARPDVCVIPVLVDRTAVPPAADLDAFRREGHGEISTLLEDLFGRTTLQVRFTRDFEPDLRELIRVLDAVPGIDPVGLASSFDVGGLQVIRPWDLSAQPPRSRAGDAKASDLWILQPKYHAVPLVGREDDLEALRRWVDAPAPISARLLVGRAGAGKTRLGFELIWDTFRTRGDVWDPGVVAGESLRQSRDWNAWVWRRPTLLVLDYALALEESVRSMLLAFTRKAQDGTLPRLRILLLERAASASEGWFHQLLEIESGTGGGPVRDLFDPAEPVALQALDSLEQRRQLLTDTLAVVATHTGQPVFALPRLGEEPEFDRQLGSGRWRDPLYLMMAALVGARDAAAAPDAEPNAMLAGLSLTRTDLALELAKHETHRLERFSDDQLPAGRRLFRHVAACATACGGLTAEQARRVGDEESAALGLQWRGGTGDLPNRLHLALPAPDEGVARVQPDIVAEALVLESLRTQGLSRAQQVEAVRRWAALNPSVVAATMFHAFQSFVADEARAGAVLEWIDALIESGLRESPSLLLAIEAALPTRTTRLREPAARVTGRLYQLYRERLSNDSSAAVRAEAGRLAINLSMRLSELGQREQALEPAEHAVQVYDELASQGAYRAELATALNTVAIRRSELGRDSDALEPLKQAVTIRKTLSEENPETFRPELAKSLNNLSILLKRLGRRREALSPTDEAVQIRRDLARENRELFMPDLARSLNNLAILLDGLGRRADAYAHAVEALDLRQELATANPDAFTPDLAISLNTLAVVAADLGLQDKALTAAERAVALHRTLAAKNPDAFEPVLAMSLTTLASLLIAARPADAIACADEAVRMRRRLAARNPDAFKEGLASSLTAQARVLLKAAHGADALQPADDAVAIYRAACRADSDPLRPERARALIMLAQARHARGLATDALAAAEESVAVLAGLTTLEPEAHAPELARALGTRALVIANTDPELAWASVREAVAHLAPQALASPRAFADLMRELGTQYLDLCRTLGRKPEPELLARLGDTRP